MNVRFSEGEIRFRLSAEEFTRFEKGETLELETLPITFVTQMARKPLNQALAMDLSFGAVHLIVCPSEVAALKSRLPSRQGIEKHLTFGEGKSWNVALEVDIKS